MNKTPLNATERNILGKKVRTLRRDGLIPAHVFGKNIPTEHVSVINKEFLNVFKTTGESGLIDLKIAEGQIRKVLVRDLQRGVVTDEILHIDFYQVNLKESVRVSVAVVLIGDEPELVRSGEAVIIQPISEIEVEALPTELPENIEVDITSLKAIGDSILVSDLQIPEGVTVHLEAESVVVKLDNAVTEEMQKLLEEQALEAAQAAQAQQAEAGETPTPEGEAPTGEPVAEGEQAQDQTVTPVPKEGGVTEEQAKESPEEKKLE